MTTTVQAPSTVSANWRKLLALSALPLFAVVTGAIWATARFGSDLRVWSADPEYAYLLNGINIATRVPPAHIDHPGTPLQVLNGVIAVVFRWVSGNRSSESVAESVVASPEAHLAVVSAVLILGLASAMLALGWRVASVAGIPLGVVAQSAPFALSTGYGWLPGEFIRNFPEAFMLPVLLAATAVIAPMVLGVVDPLRERRIALGLGICLGTAAALKINAWPIVVLLPWVAVNWRFALRTYLVTAVTALLWLLPVITQGRQMLAFWLASGGGFTDVFLSLEPLLALMSIDLWVPGVFLVSWAALMVGLAFGALRRNVQAMLAGNERLLGYATVTAVLVWIQVSMLLSRSPWWIIPVLPFLGLGFVAVFVLIGRWVRASEFRTLRRVAVFALVLGMIVPSAIATVRMLQETRELSAGEITEALERTDADLLIVDRGIAWSYTRFSDECISLHFGDYFAGGIAVREIAQRCPHVSLVYSGADPNFTDVGPHDAEVTGRPPLSCNTVADQLARGSRIYLLVNGNPNLENTDFDVLATEQGWTLSNLRAVDCSA